MNTYSSKISSTYGIANTPNIIWEEELKALGCNAGDNLTCGNYGVPTWVYSTSYWIRTDTSESRAWAVRAAENGKYRNTSVTNGDFVGVRPVLKIAESLF